MLSLQWVLGVVYLSYTAKRTKSKYVRRKMQACRQRLGFTCQQVADKAFITREYYIKIENGQSAPARLTMMLIGEALQTKRWDLLYELQSVENNKA